MHFLCDLGKDISDKIVAILKLTVKSIHFNVLYCEYGVLQPALLTAYAVQTEFLWARQC